MSELQAFVDEIRSKLGQIGPEDFVASGQLLSLDAAVLIKLELDDLSQRFLEILGKERVEEFYQDYEPKEVASSFHLMKPLAQLIPACCHVSSDRRVSLDTERLLENLTRFADCIRSGEVPFSFALRMTNIDIDTDFELGDGIGFQKIPPEVVQHKYPIQRQFTPVLPMQKQHWLNHRVEVVIPGRGIRTDFQQRLGFKQTEALVNSILHTFLLADIPAKSRPFVTHVVVDSPIEGRCVHWGSVGMSSHPTLLTSDDIKTLQKTYAFLKDAENDRVLRTAVDRFILGKKRGEHHPNRINEPNWDKIVDYVIAMETLFLTVDGNGVAQELAYRFRLNGSSLLHQCTGDDARQAFYALKHLYALRSKVVHGCDDSKIQRPANKFIKELQIDCPNHQHSLGRLMLVSKKVEEWLSKLLLYLGSVPAAERPFRKKDAWEEILWQS